MYLADGWSEYEVLDTSSGEKLERFGKYILVRPDPQVIWSTPHDAPEWKMKNAHYHRSSKGGGEWEFFDLPEQWSIHYLVGSKNQNHTSEKSLEDGDLSVDIKKSDNLTKKSDDIFKSDDKVKDDGFRLTFNLKPFTFKHTGIFPEQAVNWEWMYRRIKNSGKKLFVQGEGWSAEEALKSPESFRVLNLFAYTGGATLACAAAGAAVTHVDAAKGMVGWAKENAIASGLGEAPVRYFVDDCVKLVEREIRRGNRYDGIVMDPPSYGRGPKGEIWKLEEKVFELIRMCSELLSDEASFFLINSYTTGLQPAVLKYMLNLTLANKFGGHTEADEVGLPVQKSAGDKSSEKPVLPCGASGRWFRE